MSVSFSHRLGNFWQALSMQASKDDIKSTKNYEALRKLEVPY